MFVNNSKRGDPSDVKQVLSPLHLQIWCCRYWHLTQWECNEMSFPFWRLYWNRTSNGEISFGGQLYEMEAESIFIIPPFTAYNTHIKGHKRYAEGINVRGKRVDLSQKEFEPGRDPLLHLFIHFNLGVPYDRVTPGIYKLEISQEQQGKLEVITEFLKTGNENFPLDLNIYLYSIITEHVARLKEALWQTTRIDFRIINAIRMIEKELSGHLSNDTLALQSGMATNSFIRLFQQEISQSPQHYIRQQKIDRACMLLHHSNASIESIAADLGFADRYHFSKVFKKVVQKTPARYRKESVWV